MHYEAEQSNIGCKFAACRPNSLWTPLDIPLDHLWSALTGIRPWIWPGWWAEILRQPGAPERSWHCSGQGVVAAQQRNQSSVMAQTLILYKSFCDPARHFP